MTCAVLKAVFPLLDGVDLASCMLVCKQWKDIAEDDYLWKCLCARRWPSLCKRPSLSTMTYYKFYGNFHKHQRCKSLPSPRLSFNDLDFYIDIWAKGQPIFSEVVSSPVLHAEIKHLMMPVEPKFSVPLGQTASVSVLVRRKDFNKFACIINKAMFRVSRKFFRARAFDYLDFSPIHPFISGYVALISLLFTDDEIGVADVCGIDMDFSDAANNETEVLWLLDMLDWK